MSLDASEAADGPDFAEDGRLLFAAECTFIHGTATAAAMPAAGPPEIAFAGRSNVGKSSLINALTNRKTLARTSHTPGRTQQLNFFALGERMRLVDMPGYGYAAVSKATAASWTILIRDFLRGRAPLLRVYLLVDARHGLKPSDLEMMDGFDRAALSYAVVLTKGDELKQSEVEGRLAATQAALATRPAAFPAVALTSAETGAGIPALRADVARLLHERRIRAPSAPTLNNRTTP